MDNYRTPLAESVSNHGSGHGSVAIAPIPRTTVVATFGGLASTFLGLSTFPADRIARSIQVEVDRFFVGPSIREPGDSINHSCSPNCGMRNATQVVAMRDIALGEELTYDYAMTDMSPYDEFCCTCGSSQCRGRVTADDWRRPDLQKRYAGWFAPHVQREIDASLHARRLTKRDVEILLERLDTNTVEALTDALRIISGRPHARWEHLLEILHIPSRAALLREEPPALDSLAAELNETRTIVRH